MLDKIKERAQAATEGPWRAGYEDGSAPNEVMTVAEHPSQTKVGVRVESGETERGRFVSFTRDDAVAPLTFPPAPYVICEIENDELPEAEQLANAEFIAHARTDIPWLVGRLGEVEKAVRTYRLMANTPASRKLAAELDRILRGEEKNNGG